VNADAPCQEYDFDYDDDDDAGMEDDAGDVENQYYKAKCEPNPLLKLDQPEGISSCELALKEENAEGALKAFRTIVDEQPEKAEW
jgi:COP9 signalosome complex subunit 2